VDDLLGTEDNYLAGIQFQGIKLNDPKGISRELSEENCFMRNLSQMII
jgi:hypothetical protein